MSFNELPSNGNLPQRVNNNQTQVFNFNGSSVYILMQGLEPLFLAKDVCDTLDIKNVSDALSNLDEDEKSTIAFADSTLGGNPNKLFVTEAGLYTLITRSNKPEAKAFRRWITHEVLPMIRKTGAYLTPKAELSFEEDPIAWGEKYLNIAKAEKAKRIEAEAKANSWHSTAIVQNAALEQQRPLVAYAETCMDSAVLIESTQIAKQLNFRSAHALHLWLHSQGVIYRVNDYWVSMAGYVHAGLGKLTVLPIRHNSGRIENKSIWKWTEQGRQFVIKLYAEYIAKGGNQAA